MTWPIQKPLPEITAERAIRSMTRSITLLSGITGEDRKQIEPAIKLVRDARLIVSRYQEARSNENHRSL